MSKELTANVKEWLKIKAKKSDLIQREKDIKSALLKYLKEHKAQSVVVDGNTVSIKAGTPSFKPTLNNVVVKKAEQNLITELFAEDKKHLLNISVKKAILVGLLDQNDKPTADLIAKHGLKIQTKETVELKD